MGVLDSINFHGYDYSGDLCQSITMQWHLTAKCDQSCKHCYMFSDDNYNLQLNRQLSTEMAFRLIDEFAGLAKKLGTTGYINLTGGDPILSYNFWDVLEYTQKYAPQVKLETIMGNPFHINKDTAIKLKQYGIKSYQISLDGLEETHDKIRKKGSFKESLRALKCLHDVGIITEVMSTVHKQNCLEIFELYKFVNNNSDIDYFSFDRMIPIGNGNTVLGDCVVESEEYKRLMLLVFEYEVLKAKDRKFVYKDILWGAFFYDLGIADPFDKENKAFCGICEAGSAGITVLADGEIYACRRLDILAGKFPQQSLDDVFFNASLFKGLRNIEISNGCHECELFYHCCGCPAIKYAFNGSPYSEEPTCWKSMQNTRNSD